MMMIYFLISLIGWLYVSLADGKSLVLIGGGLSDGNAAIWNKIIELGGGSGVARIGIVTAASADPVDSGNYYIEMLLQYGALEAYFIPVYEANKAANSDPVVVQNINRMTGFIFGGGDQARIINSFYNGNRSVESPALAAIRRVYDNGGVISGTSAGVSCLPWAVMVMGGVSYNALAYGAYPDGQEISSNDLTYDPLGGIEIVYDYALDTHFSERGREGRMIRLISDTMSQSRGVKFGIGVDEDTAFVITNAGTLQSIGEVVGRANVVIFDLSTAVVDPGSQYYSISDVVLHTLTHGDKMNIQTRIVTFDSTWKQNIKGKERYLYAASSSNIFGGLGSYDKSEFNYVSTSVFDALLDNTARGTTREILPRFQVTFRKVSESVGFVGTSPVTGVLEIAYSGLKVDIAAL